MSNRGLHAAWVAALLGAGVSALVAAGARTVAFADLEYWALDFLVNHGGYAQPSSSIVLVDFDDATFARIREYPIPRRTIAATIEKVAAGRPRVIGLDMFLSEARSADEDDAMRSALRSAGNVVVASQDEGGGLPVVRPLEVFCAPEKETRPPSGFCDDATTEKGGALGYAFVNLPVESDGFVRRFPLFASGAEPAVSFALMLAQQYAGEPVKPGDAGSVSFAGRTVRYADASDRTVWIGSWNPALVTRVPAIDLLESRADAAVLRDKLVLVGQSHDAARDRMLTPLFRPQPANGPRLRLSGAEVHASAIATLLDGRPIVAVPTSVTLAILFLASVAAIAIVLRYDLTLSIALISLSVAALVAAALCLFAWTHVWLRYATVGAGILLSVPAGVSYRFVQEKLLRSAIAKEREQIMGLFGRYVSPDVAQEIWNRRAEVVLAGEERVATVLFSDIRSFTAMTAGKPSRAVLAWLNAYLTAMDQVIREHGGFLNKFIGDGIMVLFGVPLSDGPERDAVRAVRAALGMLERVEALNRQAGASDEFGALRIGIGLHTGRLTCGNVGSSTRLEYSVIGETVNLASRLESLTKDFHTGIVMSEATAEAIRAEFPALRDLGEAPVRGFSEKVRLYTIDTPQAVRS